MEALQFIGSLQKCGRVCRGGVSSCASHPLRLLVLLVALFSFGWGNAAYADTYYWYYGLDDGSSTLTVTKSSEALSASDHSFSVNGKTINGAVKLNSSGYVTFTTSKTATVTLGISTKKTLATTASQSYVNFDNEATEKVLTTDEVNNSNTPKEIEIRNVAAGPHTITKGETEMGIYYIKVVETPTALTADFTYGSTKWTSPTQDEMTITVPSHKGGKTFEVTLSNISDGATATCTQNGTLNGNTLTITAPTYTASAAEQTTTVTLTNGNASTTYNIKVTTEAKTGITFDPNKRYSQLLIDNRTASFYANTTASGINSTSGTLDYVPGLVAKAMIEAVDYYKDNPAGDITVAKVKEWFDKVQGYGDNHTIKDPGTKGESFDDLNAVKLYFGLKSVAASKTLSDIADNTTGWNEKIKSALAGIKTANTNYVIKSGTGAADMEGGWWHKSKYVNQMWCDGQYMGTALLAQMINDDQYKDGEGGNSVTGTKNGDWDLICKQLDITWNYLWNDETKLIHHAFAADNGTASTSSMWKFDTDDQGNKIYRNEACWARAAGWYFLALIDVLEQMDKAKYSGDKYNTIKTHLQTLAAGLKARQDAETGCWYQLPLYDGTYSATDCGNGATKTRVYNYLESSATAIFAASYLKGIRLGYLDKNTYEETAKKAYKGIIEHFMTSDNNIYWSSRSAGLGTATSGKRLRTGSNAYYLKGFDVVPTKVTDNGSKDETEQTTLAKGTEGKVLGAMILAAVEYERAYMSNKGNLSGSATFTLDQLNNFAGTVHDTGVKTAYTTGDGYITLSSTSENVQAQMTANTGTKVRNTGTFTITPKSGATISKVVLMTSRDNKQLTSTPDVTPTRDGKNYTYTFANVSSPITFTNNNSGYNICITSIIVEYEYTSTSEKTQLRGSFDNDITGYVGDNGIALPALTVTAGGNALTKGTDYTVTYQSSNTSAVTIANEKINLIAAGNAVITATITPKDAQYAATTATFTVTSLPLVDLVVDVPDVTMYTTASAVTQPSVTVYALVNGVNTALTAGTDYTVAYKVKTSSVSPSNVTDGNSITVTGTPGNYTAGNNVITVTVTPTPAGVNAYHCKATTKDFNYNVVTAGQKLTPTVVVSENISYQVSTAKDVTVSVVYDGNDITDLFKLTSTLSTETYGSVEWTKANVFTFTPKDQTNKEEIILTITATPIDAYADQYYTVTKTCTLNIVDKALAIEAALSATEVNIGENIYFTSVTVKDNEGKILSIDDGECTVEYQSSAPSVLAINASTGVMTPLAEGETTVKVIARKDAYASASWTKTVTVIDPTVYKAATKSGEAAPENGKVVTDVDGMAMTYGGWMFESGISRTVTNAAGTNTESKEYFGEKNGTSYGWGKAATDGAGSLSNFKYSFMGNSHQNPRDEMGANALPEGYYNIGYQGHDNIKPIDPMFNVPVEGAYITFAPKTNGTVIAHVLQEGAFSGSYDSSKDNGNKLVYRRDRRVLVLNEMGQRLNDVKATLDVTTGKMPKDKSNTSKIITDVTKYEKLVKNTYLTKEYDFTKDFVGFTGFNIDNNNEITNFQNGLYKFYGKEGDPNYGVGDGWGVLVKAPVTYEFKVKAGKTYYLYNYGSKINVFGFQFKPDANVVVDNVEYNEQQNNTITSTPDGHVASVSLDRKFVVDKWNAAVLPFSLNKQQVDAIFGQTYDKNHTDGTQILYFEKTDGKYVYYTRHAYNTIVAGKPFLIKPTGKTANKTDVATLVDGSIVLNTEKITAFPYVTIENVSPKDWGRDAATADYHWHSAYNVETVKPNDYYFNSKGVLVMREKSDAMIQAFRGFLQKKATAQAKLFSVAYFDLLSDNSDIPSKIEGVMMDSNGELVDIKAGDAVYNLSGQVVTTNASSLYSLPKGIYIVNGKKYVVE